MSITFTIPDGPAQAIAALAESQGLTPEQWVHKTIKAGLGAQDRPRMGRPTVNMQRDAEIRAKRAAGASILQLSQEFGLSKIRIDQITAVGRL
jgi:hypothetical protein